MKKNNVVISEDEKAAVWAGTIDDIWKMGKPVGMGGPWKNTEVQANIASDPYLIGFYDNKNVTLSHDSPREVTFTLEVEPIGHGPWMVYKKITVPPGEKVEHIFPEYFQTRWIRVVSDKDCEATVWFIYK